MRQQKDTDEVSTYNYAHYKSVHTDSELTILKEQGYEIKSEIGPRT